MAATNSSESQLRNLVMETSPFKDPDLLQVLQDLLHCSSYTKKISLLQKAILLVKKYARVEIAELMNRSTKLSSVLDKVIDLAIVPAFEARDYFSYSESDFKWYPETAEEVLGLLTHFLIVVKLSSDLSMESSMQNEHAMLHGFLIINSGNVQTPLDVSEKMKECITNVLPKLVLLIGGYSGKHSWSSASCVTEASQLLHEVKNCFSCDSAYELFTTVHVITKITPCSKGKEQSLLAWFMSYCEEQLSNHKWQRNPFLSQTFVNIICQIGCPALNDYFHMIRATSLSFLDDHQVGNKIMGIRCLHHLIKHSSASKMNLFGEGNVIYDALKMQLYSKEPEIVRTLLPCLFDLLALLEKPPAARHHDTFQIILFSAQSENILTLQMVYIKFVKDWVNQMGIACVKYLKTLLSVISSYLLVNDGVDGQNCLNGLKLLHVVLEIAWPRMAEHSTTIVQMLLNVVLSVNYDQWVLDNPMAIWADISNLAIDCMELLSQLNPDVKPCIEKCQQIKEERGQQVTTI